jgi:ATP-dependent DNA helicase RecG
MEGEGSGYDLVYEKLARDAKPMPEIETDFTKVSVTVYAKSMNPEVLSILDYIDKHFMLTQKEYITLGIIASHKKMPATQLALFLQLSQDDRTRTWLGTLLDKEILVAHGEKKGTQYLLNPTLFEQAQLNIIPSLKTMELYKLAALIKEDLKYNGKSSMGDIKKRLQGASESDIQRAVYKLVSDQEITTSGAKKNRVYELVKKK